MEYSRENVEYTLNKWSKDNSNKLILTSYPSQREHTDGKKYIILTYKNEIGSVVEVEIELLSPAE